LTIEVGGPLADDRRSPGFIVKFFEEIPLPAGVTTVILPVAAAAGTVAVTVVSDSTLNEAAAPLNRTEVAPVRAEPLTVTLVPMVPDVGENEETTGGVAEPGKVTEPRPPTTSATGATTRKVVRTRNLLAVGRSGGRRPGWGTVEVDLAPLASLTPLWRPPGSLQ
jgi:hypothetical protein